MGIMYSFIWLFCLFAGAYSALAQPASGSSRLNVYLTDLNLAVQNIQENNYEQVVYQKVCPYMNKLQLLEQQQKIHPQIRQKFLELVVNVYGRAFDFSQEHYLMYCLYNYYKSSKPPEDILRISQQILSHKKQTQFISMWKICDKEEKQGNGDNHTVSAKNTSNKNSYLLSKEDYANISPDFRLSYIQKIKKAFLDFELNQTARQVVSFEKRANFKAFLFDFFVVSALAQSQCLIGGKMRPLVYSKRLRRTVCPVYGNSCGGSKNNFQCGVVFSSACIPINPVRSVSERCYKASQNEPLSLKNYAKYKSYFDNVINNYCVGRKAKRAGCIYFMNKINQINSSFTKTSPVKKPSSAKTQVEAKTSADAVCTKDCEKKNSDVTDIAKAIQTVQTEDITQHFSDTIFDNAKCKCGGNNGCKRGCQPKDQISKDQSPPIVPCKGEKTPYKSTGNCMRHVTGAIMSVIRQKLAVYCNEEAQNAQKDYYQCMKDFNFPSRKNNICRNGFVFPSALCALNLDGKSAGDFQKITNSKVRKNCKTWDKLNQSLTTFPVKQDDGTVKQIPLFKKVPLENSGFQKDPSKIPNGAIVVMQSPTKHGHVEIKTNRNKCGIDQKQACFCSDFCRSRSQYNAPFKVQAVFQWNPEIVQYAKQSK